MTSRYRYKEWVALKKRLPLAISQDIGYMLAPPKFVLLSFASVSAKEYIERELGPSLEPDKTINLLHYKQARRSEDTSYADFPDS